VSRKHALPERAFSDLVTVDLAFLFMDVPKMVLLVLFLTDLDLILFLHSSLNISGGAVKCLPEVSLNCATHILGVEELGSHQAHGVLEVYRVVQCGSFLTSSAGGALPDVDVVSQVQDENIGFT